MATHNTCPKASRLSILHPAPPTHPTQFLTDLVFSHYKLEPKQGAGAGAASSGRRLKLNTTGRMGPDRGREEE